MLGHPLVDVLLPALATGLATTVGALPFLVVDSIPRRTYDALLGFGAGLMLAAATLGLLSTALHDLHPAGTLDATRFLLVLAGFAGGVGILRVMDSLIPHEHAAGHHLHMHHDVHEAPHSASESSEAHHHDPHCALDAAGTAEGRTARMQGLLVVGVMALHRLPEGIAIGAAYAGGGRPLGLTLVSAIAVQNAVEGAVMAAPLRRGGLGRLALIALVAATGMAVPIAAIAGYALSSSAAGALPPMLALAAGALIYLASNEVIPESHSHGNEVRATFGVVAGFVVIMLLQAVFGHGD
jgi:ZIP family zinc transporter